MVYLFLDKSAIKVLALSKALLGQYTVSHFSKVHSTELLKDGQIANMDLVASAVKEALTTAKPEPISEKKVFLILPQEAFHFGRYTIPADMSDSAIEPFVKDKARSELNISIDDTHFDYIISKEDGEGTVLFYGISNDYVEKIQDTFQLIDLSLEQILPDTLAYYTLFAKTLRKEKKERILYTTYHKANSFAYLFDSLGLSEKTRFEFSEKIKPELKKKVKELEKADGKLNRIILSGKESRSIRQDLFTKDVGAWTNPLEKIVDNFYQDYLKMTVSDEDAERISVLDLDTCFGAFVFDQLHGGFSLYSKGRKPAKKAKASSPSGKKRVPSFSLNLGGFGRVFNMKTILIFVVSFVVSFGLIFGLSRLSSAGFDITAMFGSNKADEPIEPLDLDEEEPTEAPTPTPSLAREDIKVKILNGSGIVGKAGEIEELLQDEGYSDIVTGNADNFDYDTSEIQVKEDKEEAFDILSGDLADLVKIDDFSTLDEDDAADIVFIIGTDIEGDADEDAEESEE